MPEQATSEARKVRYGLTAWGWSEGSSESAPSWTGLPEFWHLCRGPRRWLLRYGVPFGAATVSDLLQERIDLERLAGEFGENGDAESHGRELL